MSLLKGKGIVLGVLAVVGVITYGAVTYLNKKSGKDEDVLLPALTQEEAEDAMTKVLTKLHGLTKRLIEVGENIKSQIRQQGHEIDDQTLYKMYILGHFESGFRDIQDSVLTECDYEESELEEAVNYYQKHGSVILQDITQKVRNIYKQFGGDIDGDNNAPDSEKTKNMSIDEALELLYALNDKVLTLTEGFIIQFKQSHGIPTTQELTEAFNHGLLTIISGAEEDVVSRVGITSNDLQQLILKYQDSPLVRTAILKMQENQQLLLIKHNIVPQQQMEY